MLLLLLAIITPSISTVMFREVGRMSIRLLADTQSSDAVGPGQEYDLLWILGMTIDLLVLFEPGIWNFPG